MLIKGIIVEITNYEEAIIAYNSGVHAIMITYKNKDTDIDIKIEFSNHRKRHTKKGRWRFEFLILSAIRYINLSAFFIIFRVNGVTTDSTFWARGSWYLELIKWYRYISFLAVLSAEAEWGL